MFRIKVLPAVYGIFAVLSLLVLRSVAPDLVVTQLVFFILGALIFAVSSRISYQYLEKWKWPLYFALNASLTYLMIVGTAVRGSTSWFSFFGLFNIQPSQLAIPVVLFVACSLVLSKTKIKLKDILLFLGLVGLPGFLIFIEPDLGTTLVFVATLGTVLWLSPVPWKTIGVFAGSTILLVVFAWFFVLRDYQKNRLTSFLFSHSDSTTNYNGYQALVAVGSGQVMGRGLGQGIQSQLKFLPEKHNDFIFAALGEETGFLGSIFVVGLYGFLIIFIAFVGEQANTVQERYFCWGIASMVAIQATINIGMNIGLLPITGVTLPLISYGGSSILATSGMYGIVQSIASKERKKAVLNIT